MGLFEFLLNVSSFVGLMFLVFVVLDVIALFFFQSEGDDR